LFEFERETANNSPGVLVLQKQSRLMLRLKAAMQHDWATRGPVDRPGSPNRQSALAIIINEQGTPRRGGGQLPARPARPGGRFVKPGYLLILIRVSSMEYVEAQQKRPRIPRRRSASTTPSTPRTRAATTPSGRRVARRVARRTPRRSRDWQLAAPRAKRALGAALKQGGTYAGR
jgi:hypothetical protein